MAQSEKMESRREHQDGPTEETRVPSVGCNMVTQRQSKMVDLHQGAIEYEHVGPTEKTNMVHKKQ